jgi:hypothetical protein
MITLERIKEVKEILKQAHRYREFEVIKLKSELKDVKRVISGDVESKIVFWGLEFNTIW